MVQIIPRASSKGEEFMKMISGGLSGAAEGGERIKGALNERAQRKSIQERFGDEFANIHDPELRNKMIMQKLLGEQENRKHEMEASEGMKDYETIKKYGGEEAAEMYRTASVGGKTAIMKSLLESLERGGNMGDLFSGLSDTIPEETRADVSEMGIDNREGTSKLPDYTRRPKGYTAKEWTKQREGWVKANDEALTTARDRLKGNKRDRLGTQKLKNINESGQLPEGLERFIVSPKTGEIYPLAQLVGKAPKAAQEWVKEIARFGNRAKDAFGSRVTNFDLVQYMKQFPSLLNTPEGRESILKMMEVNYELDSLYDTAVQKIIDQKGAGNIPPDEVDRIARSRIKEREDQLFNEYLHAEVQNEMSFLREGSERQSLEDIFGG